MQKSKNYSTKMEGFCIANEVFPMKVFVVESKKRKSMVTASMHMGKNNLPKKEK